MKKMLFAIVLFLSFSINAFATVNLNTATQAELETLKNIGPAKAIAIMDYRKKNGGFKSVDDLNNVPGIGDKTMANLKAEVTVSGATKVTTPVAIDAKKAIKAGTPIATSATATKTK
jgi:competence protein ComEA